MTSTPPWMQTPPTPENAPWAVWSKVGTGFAPETRTYTSQYKAEERARQMAEANPGTTFYVARLVSGFNTPKPKVQRVDIPSSDFTI